MSIGRHEPADYCFDPGSPLRQGDLLRELTRLDPALNAHPRVDRYLVSGDHPFRRTADSASVGAAW